MSLANSALANATGCGGGVKCSGKALARSSIAFSGVPPVRDPWAIFNDPRSNCFPAAGAGAASYDIASALKNASTATANASLQYCNENLDLQVEPEEL